MIIYSMTATFGKLEHKTLTLNPGLNILEAPNEWGKSTWCAFFTAMLYGIDTRARSSASVLAEKEKFAPWSGMPMEGSMDLNWNGRDITIQRRTKGRIPMGVFRAFETKTGLEIPELTASNCGQMLLGVERSVFLRAGFLKLSDLPVTQDEALRYRLNALVTTGDESATGVLLEQKLKELKNKCRYNKTGLLPQAQEQLAQAEKKLASLQELSAQADEYLDRTQQLDTMLSRLKNHREHLIYEEAQEGAQQLAAAQEAVNQAKLQADVAEYNCREIPSREEALNIVQNIRALQQKWIALQTECRTLPSIPEKPDIPPSMMNIPPEKAVETALADSARFRSLRKKSGRVFSVLLVLSMAILIATGFLVQSFGMNYLWLTVVGSVLLLASGIGLLTSGKKNRSNKIQAKALIQRYGDANSQGWIVTAEAYARKMDLYSSACRQAETMRKGMEQKLSELDSKANELTGGQDLQIYLVQWQQVLSSWDLYEEARRNYLQQERQLQAIRSVVRTPDEPSQPDDLLYSLDETNQMINEYQLQQRQQQQLLGQCLGKKDSIGHEEILLAEISDLKKRISKLEQWNDALEIAQNALTQATSELQRRFAPRITARAQELFAKLTRGRYEQLRFDADFSLSTSAAGENTLRSSLWRSDGTSDQMYLALRLAVAEILTPDAPMILDDALVRFDDDRLLEALTILSEEAAQKQVILFTCQSREKTLWENRKIRHNPN